MTFDFETGLSRRLFLRGTGGGLLLGSALASAGPVFAQSSGAGGGGGMPPPPPDRPTGRPMPEMEKTMPEAPGKRLGYAIVGLGQFALNQIIPSFAESKSSKLVALVSGNRDKALQVADRYGVDPKSVYDYQTFDRIADNDEIDIVYITLPNALHAEYTVRAFKAGKHVLCEKPMAVSVAECEAMIAACRKAKKKLMIGYRSRFEPHNIEAIRLRRENAVGKPRFVQSEHGFPIGDPAQWRLKRALAGGGSMMDIGIYALNAARYLTGEEPAEVHAMMDTTPNDPRFKEVEENITFQLRFPSGVLANCTSSYGVPLNRFRVVGTNGWAELEPALSYDGLKMRAGTWTKIEERIQPVISHFAAEMDHLVDCIRNDKQPLTPGEEGLKDMRLIEAVYKSAATGQSVKT
jgi:glucose-fructose oxidoreductase